MKLQFLGTGTSMGVPVIGCKCDVCTSSDPRDARLRASALFTVEGKNILIDAGPDFRMQMLRANCTRLHGILLTHMHYDHVGGLDDLRCYNYLMNKPIDVFADRLTAESLHRSMPYVFAEHKYPGVPLMSLTQISDEPFTVEGIRVTPIPVMHCKLPIYGYRIGNWAYITDASYVPDSSIALLQGCDVLVLNALRPKPHLSHFSLQEALDVVERVAPKRAYFTHMCHDIGLHADADSRLPQGVHFAYDGLIIE